MERTLQSEMEAALGHGSFAHDAEARSTDVRGERPKIVAVDGPAGSGKSSICHKVAERVGWSYINTGALYRAVGLLAARRRLDLTDERAVGELVDDLAPQLSWRADRRELWLSGEDLTPQLLSEAAGAAASVVAKQSLMRERLLPVQRQLTLSSPVGALVDGRDIGTVVFPDADLKIFLTASLEERSRRRLQQLGGDASQELLDNIKAGIAARDEQDGARGVAPMKQAADAVVVDTSFMGVEETVDTIVRLLRQRGLVP
jgi:cytidylate kinase